jgi:hypothetical protein
MVYIQAWILHTRWHRACCVFVAPRGEYSPALHCVARQSVCRGKHARGGLVRSRGKQGTKMNANQPLGSLAHAVIEQFGERARRAMGQAVERRTRAAKAVSGRRVDWRLFTEQELAYQPLRPGNWVTIGEIHDGNETILIEFNLGTWEIRELRETGLVPIRQPRPMTTASSLC